MFSFWQKFLFVVSLIIIAFGISLALLNGTFIFKLLIDQINNAFWSADNITNEISRFQQWIYGAWGATVAGWGIILAFIVYYPFKKKETWSWTCIFVGIMVWFVIDTLISLYYQVYFNAIFNIILFISVVLPLIFTRKSFKERK